MEDQVKQESSGESKPPSGIHLQSMDDFMKETDPDRDGGIPRLLDQRPNKKQKKNVDTDALAAEEEAVRAMGDTNWIGKLNEYRSAHPPAEGLTYHETAVPGNPPRFTCAVTLRETPLKFNATAAVTFSNKKHAKHYASKRVVDWLIGNGFMPKDGSVKFPKAQPPQAVKRAKIPPPQPKSKLKQELPSHPSSQNQTTTQAQSPTENSTAPSDGGKTKFSTMVPELCERLGFEPPSYELTKVAENGALYNGYAHFRGDPRIDGPIGEVNNVYGRKDAKEAIAEELVSFLQSIEKHRREQQELDDRKRKRESGDESVHEDLEAQAAQAFNSDEKTVASDFFP